MIFFLFNTRKTIEVIWMGRNGMILEWNFQIRRRKVKSKDQWMSGVRRRMINKYLAEDAEGRNL